MKRVRRTISRLGIIADKLRRLTYAHVEPELLAPPPRRILAGSAHDCAEPFRALLGESSAMRRVRRRLTRIGTRSGDVLLTGEIGTGKELAARALHDARTPSGPFVPVNAGAFTRELAASKLFGHRKGAFTGADRDRTGAFRKADGGTLFLDEINSLSLEVQPELLRVLDTRRVTPVGADEGEPVDVRVICAANVPLEEEVEAGQFRADLFHRVSAYAVTMPPLRDRPDDLALLAHHFLARQAVADSRPVPRLGPGALELLAAHGWPGNVRELQNVLRRATLECEGEHPFVSGTQVHAALGPEHPRESVDAGGRASDSRSYQELMTGYERGLLRRHLVDAGWNDARAGRTLGMSRQALAYRIEKLGIACDG